ncbi:MAG: YfhO family protein [Clostridiales bacterium]|nr:YfhO family protein [Clostridiales bacterium]
MWNYNISQKKYIQPIFAALLTIGLFLLIYFIRGLYPFGDGSIMITDMYSQYVPLLYRFYDVVMGEKSLFFDFSVSGGANLYVDTINEIINPFNYVLLLFGRQMIYKAVNVLLLLYAAAAAAAANIFLLKVFPKNNKCNLILSLCYAMSGYMAYNYQIIKWLLFPVIFPFFCLALRRLIKEGKGVFYALLLAYQICLSIQIGFMTLLFTLFSSGIYFYCCKKKEKRRGAMFRLGVYTFIGLLLSAGVLIPNLMILLSSSRADENLSYFGIMKRHGFDDLFERLFQIAHPVLLAAGAWLIIRRFIIKRKCIGKTDNIIDDEMQGKRKFFIFLNIFLWLTVLLQPANLIWHMGSYVCFPVRYAYMVLLSGISLIKFMAQSVECVEGASGIKRAVITMLMSICVIVLCVVACILTFLWNYRITQAFSSLAISLNCKKETIQVCIILLLFFAAAFCAVMTKYKRQLLICVSMVSGVCFWLFILLPQNNPLRDINETAYVKLVQQTQKADNNALYRTKIDYEMPANAPLVNRQSSLGGYLPTGNQNFQNTMENLGYLVHWVATQDIGGTDISDRILSEGMVFYKGVSELELKGDSPLKRQEEMGIFAAGESCLEIMALSEVEAKGIEIDDSGAEAKEIKINNSGVVCLNILGRQNIYLDSGLSADSFMVFINGEELEIPESDVYYGPHRLVDLGTYVDEEIEVLISDKDGNPLPVENMEIALLDVNKWSQVMDEGKSDSARLLTAQELSVDEAKGRISVVIDNADKSWTIFLPVAAIDGWSCVLNGEKSGISDVFGFLGTESMEGRNEIIFKFIPPGIKLGSLLMLIGLITLVIDTMLKVSLSESVERKAAWIYEYLFALGLIIVYIIPAFGLAIYIVMKVLRIS